MSGPAVLLLEFNELVPPIIDRLIDEGKLPNFARMRAESTLAITDPEEPQSGLEPWIQWVTVHTGVGRAEHGLQKLGEAARLDHTTIADVVAEAGRTSWICGSMNIPRNHAGRGPYLPDPWNPDSEASPRGLEAFADFVRANVQEHSNESARPSPSAVVRFGWHQLRHGLRPETVRSAMGQLVAERRGRRGRWARASVLDRFQWDVFRWHWDREQPAFATFFSNSTAHYQHVYWRHFEPELFSNRPSAEEQARFGDAVVHGYRAMDRLVGEAMELADDAGATLMLCTALSQQPYTKAEAAGGKYIYRPHRHSDLVGYLGIEGVREIAPVMAEEFHLCMDDADHAEQAAERLRTTMVGDHPAFRVRLVGDDVFTGCALHDVVPEDALLGTTDGRTRLFSDLFYRSETVKSGFHHPDGLWWIRTGEHAEIGARVSLRTVAPTVLAVLGLEPPPTMRAEPITLANAQ